MKVIFLTAALQRLLFCSTYNNKCINYVLRSTLEQLGNCFEKYSQYLKIQTIVLLKNTT